MSAVAQDVQRDIQEAGSRQSALDAERKNSAQARDAALQPLEAQVNQEIGSLQSVKPPPQAQLPTYQPKPLVDPKEYQQTSLGLVAMALVAGIASKGNWLGVSSSLNGALKGFLEGNQERAQKEYQDYKTQFDAAKAKSEAEQKDFADILQNKRLSINDMLTQIKITAAKYGRDDVRMEAEQKSIDGIWKRIETMDQTIYRTNEQNMRLQEAIAAKLAAAKTAAGDFSGDKGELLAALAERGVSLPAGFRSKQQQQALLAGLIERNPGKTPDEIADLVEKGQIAFGAEKKETSTAAGVAGRVAVAQNEIKQFVPLVRESSAKVPRGTFVPITDLLQRAEGSISDPNLKDLRIKINSLLNAYDMLAARGGTDKHKREEAHALLTSADSPEALETGLRAFEQEAEAAERAAQAAEQPHGSAPAVPPPEIQSLLDKYK